MEYYKVIINSDILWVDNVKRDEEWVKRIMCLYVRY